MRKSSAIGLVTAAMAVCVTGLAPASLAADATWTVTPGGSVTGTAGTTVLRDDNTGTSLTCASSTTQADLAGGTGLPGAGIATVTSVSFNDCRGPLGISFSVSTDEADYKLNAVSFADGVTTGTLEGVTASLSGLFCSATVAGESATTPGTLTGTYTNSTATLAVSGGNLHVWNVSGCFGLINNGDAVSYTASYTFDPAQTITSP